MSDSDSRPAVAATRTRCFRHGPNVLCDCMDGIEPAPAAPAERPDWRCTALRSHGPCNTSNAGDERCCGACGAERPSGEFSISETPSVPAERDSVGRERLDTLLNRFGNAMAREIDAAGPNYHQECQAEVAAARAAIHALCSGVAPSRLSEQEADALIQAYNDAVDAADFDRSTGASDAKVEASMDARYAAKAMLRAALLPAPASPGGQPEPASDAERERDGGTILDALAEMRAEIRRAERMTYAISDKHRSATDAVHRLCAPSPAPSVERLRINGMDVDELLAGYQRACELVVTEGDSNLSRTTKERAIYRNELRAYLLKAAAIEAARPLAEGQL